MSTLTIRNLDLLTHGAIRVHAATKGASMEETVRRVLTGLFGPKATTDAENPNWFAEARSGMVFDTQDDDDLMGYIPARDGMREPVDFSQH
jgi:plasmid stability protein